MTLSTPKDITTSKPKFSVYVSPELQAAIVREAKKERRSRSKILEILLEEALKVRGYRFTISADLDDL